MNFFVKKLFFSIVEHVFLIVLFVTTCCNTILSSLLLVTLKHRNIYLQVQLCNFRSPTGRILLPLRAC